MSATRSQAPRRPLARGPARGAVGTLNEIAALLRFFGRVEVRFQILRFWPGTSTEARDVAFLSPSKAVVLAPVYEGGVMVQRARNLGKAETAEDAAREILRRFVGLRAA